jgi:hypothetical protein
MMRAGRVWALTRLAPRTAGSGGGVWRTPTAQEAGALVETLETKGGEPARVGERAYRKKKDGTRILQSVTLGQQVKMWPTPRANKVGGVSSERFSPTLEQTVKMWPTPTVNDSKNDAAPSQLERNSHVLNVAVKMWPMDTEQKELRGGKLNPTWVEWLMGWPAGWTALKHWATDRFRSKPRLRSCC